MKYSPKHEKIIVHTANNNTQKHTMSYQSLALGKKNHDLHKNFLGLCEPNTR